MSDSTVTASYTVPTQTNYIFSNSNNVSFGTNASTVTATASFAQSVQTQGSVVINGSSGSIVFSNSNGFTFGNNNSTITGSYTVPTDYVSTGQSSLFEQTSHTTVFLTNQSNQAYSAGNGSETFQTLSFADSNGVSFSSGTQGLYATVKTDYQSSGAYLTTARASNDAVGLNTAKTNVTWTVNSSGISLDAGAYLTAQSAQTAISGVILSNTTYTSGSISFRDGNGISWASTTGQGMSITHGLQFTSATSAITSNALNTSQSSLFQHTTATSAVTSNALNTSASRVINILAATNNTGGGTASLSSNVSFSNANNFTFYTSAGNAIVGSFSQSVDTVKAGTGVTTAGGGGLSATLNTNGLSISIPSWLTTADLSANSSNYFRNWKLTGNTAGTTSSAQGTDLWFGGGNGVTISGSSNSISFSVATNYQSQGAYLTTAGLSQDSSKYAGTDITTAGGAGFSGTLNTAGLSVSIPSWLTTAALSTQTNAFSLGGNTGTTNSSILSAGGYIIAGGSNVTLSMSNNSLSIHAQSQSVQTQSRFNLTLSGNSTSAGGGYIQVSSGVLTLAGGNNITLSQDGNAVTISGPNAGGAQTAISGIVLSNTTYTSGTVSFRDGNGISWASTTGQGISITHDLQFTSATSAITSNALHTSAARIQAVYDGANSISSGTIRYTNANGFSFSINGQTLSGSVATTYRASNDAIGLNTAQSNVTWTANSSGLSLDARGYAGTGTTFNGANISGSITQNSVGLQLSLSSPADVTISSYENINAGLVASSGLAWNGASVSYAVAFNVPEVLSYSFMRFPALMTTNSTTIATMASATASASGGLFSTLNAVFYSMGVGASSRSLQSVTSASVGFSFTQQISVTNSTQASYSMGITGQAQGASTTLSTQYSVSQTNYAFSSTWFTNFTSARWLDLPFAGSLNAGAYWLVAGLSSSTASAGAAGLAALTNGNVRYASHYAVSALGALVFGIMGSSNITSVGADMGVGSFSTAGGGTTNSIPVSAVSSALNNPRMYFQLLRSA